MRVAIVGAGLMGLSVAWACHRRGWTVAVYEQGPIPNPAGSSVDDHRIIREPYGDMAGYAAMVGDAFRAWDTLWDDLGERLYVETGVLALDGGGENWVKDSVRTATALGTPFERLDPGVLAERYPFLDFTGIEAGFRFSRGGALLAGRIIESLAHRLATDGVEIRGHMAVVEIDPETGRLTLADGETVGADAVIVAAGPWVGRLLPTFAKRVTPSRQVVAYIAPPERVEAAWHDAPVIIEARPDAGYYLIPPRPGMAMKVGDHRFSLSGDPDRDRAAGESEARAVLELCRPRFRDFDAYRLRSGKTCFYTVEPEERFLVEPTGERAWVATGFSGHGFKFGALIGLALAEALAGDRDPGALSEWAAGKDEAAP